jgi:NitT/TauT family transport system substrate-binding protein
MARLKITFISVIGLTLAVTFVAAAEAQLPKLRVAYTAVSGLYTILWTGQEAGLFKKHGIETDLVLIQPSSKAAQILISGDVDIVDGGAPTVLNANLQGADLVIIASNCNRSTLSFFTTPSINRIQDLKGKVLGVTRFGASNDFETRYILQKNNLQPGRDVSLLQTGGYLEMLAAFEKNHISGGLIGLPLSLRVRKLGLKELFGPEANPVYDIGSFFVKRSFIKDRRGDLKRFLRALVTAFDLANQNPEVAKRAVGKYTRIGDREALDATYTHYSKTCATRIPLASTTGLNLIKNFMVETIPDAKRLNVEPMIDHSLVKELQQEGL